MNKARTACSRFSRALLGAGVVLATAAMSPAVEAFACPFCTAPSLTLTEQIAQSDAVVLVKWAGGDKPKDETRAGATTYEIVEVHKGSKQAVEKGGKITLARYRAGKESDLFLLLGSKATVVEWGGPQEVTRAGYEYLAKAPDPEAPTAKRLEYYVKYLEFPDEMVANDAYAEFANAPYKDIAVISGKLPRDRIRKWVASDDTTVTRMGLYGLLLGLCGSEDDVAMLKKKIAEPTDEFRLGIDGVISGYLLLTGEKGLDFIDRVKLTTDVVLDVNGKPVKDSKGEVKKLPFSETYAAMQALRFMWTYAEGRVDKDRLRQSMRILLDRPELADLVIADLARWKDWSVQDRLMELYDEEEYAIPSVKRAIVRYMLVCAKDAQTGADGEAPDHVAEANKHLARLRKEDPKTVRDAERFFFLK